MELSALVKTFISNYDAGQQDALWSSHSARFRKFWTERVMAPDSGPISDDDCDEIIRILDRNAKGNTKDSEAVAKAMIPQGAWRRMLNEFRSNQRLRALMDQILTEEHPTKKASFINALYDFNAEQRNNLTGPSGNAIGAFLAAYDPSKNLSVISLKDRRTIIDFLGLSVPFDWDADSIGTRIVVTNKVILEGASKLGLSGSARTITRFFYSRGIKELWKSRHLANKRLTSARSLQLWQEYTREEVHSIFSPETPFTPQRGTWGLQGMIRVPSRPDDWVFFVTFGKTNGGHVFDESITADGVLSWQSQPAQRLEDTAIQTLIRHDERINTIHLFVRTDRSKPYGYLGPLGYLTHDISRECPVHFQWQLLKWPVPETFLQDMDLHLVESQANFLSHEPKKPATLTIERPPEPTTTKRSGVGKEAFQKRKNPDYAANDARNRELGRKGELLVIAHEKALLVKAGRADLSEKIVHVADVEGDSAGYDIRSYEPDGRHRNIEVKTTRGGATTAFFISPNEIDFSARNQSNYFLYRLYEYDDKTGSAKTFLLSGSIEDQVLLEPTAYRAKLGTS